MLQAIFYARFHPERGPTVIHQHPSDSIIPPASHYLSSSHSSHSSHPSDPLINFSHHSSTIIPPDDLCNRPLSFGVKGLQVLGFPVSVEDSKYQRNRFTFNVCFVLPDVDAVARVSWPQVVAKTASFFRQIEEEDGLLQAEEDHHALKWAGDDGYPARDVGVVHRLLAHIFDELTTYSETCARVDDTHVLNLRLHHFPRPPPEVHAWQVPLLIRALPLQQEWAQDLSLRAILPHIDGVRHVQKIALLADVDLANVKRAVQELVFHRRVTLTDIFHFQAVYMLTSDFPAFVNDRQMQDECLRYVAAPAGHAPFKPTVWAIQSLYRALGPGTTVQDLMLTSQGRLLSQGPIDVRRLISFGVLKGFLRRVQKYCLIAPPSAAAAPSSSSSALPPFQFLSHPRNSTLPTAPDDLDHLWKHATPSSGWQTPTFLTPHQPHTPAETSSDPFAAAAAEQRLHPVDAVPPTYESLRSFLDGEHCLDQVCVHLGVSETTLVERLRRGSAEGAWGNVVFFCRY